MSAGWSSAPVLRPGERIIEADRDLQLVALSFAISWLGAYTTCQLLSHANSIGRNGNWTAWVALASLCFGLVGIWALHFIAVLSASLDVSVRLNPFITVVSALVAAVFTFAAFTSDSGSSKSHGWWNMLPHRWTHRGPRRRKPIGKGHTQEQEDIAAEEGLLEGYTSHRTSEDGLSVDGNASRSGSSRQEMEDAATERGRCLAGEAPMDPALVSAAGLDPDDDEEEEGVIEDDVSDYFGDQSGLEEARSEVSSTKVQVVPPEWASLAVLEQNPPPNQQLRERAPRQDDSAARPEGLRRTSTASGTTGTASGLGSPGFYSSTMSPSDDFSSLGGGEGMAVSMNRNTKRRLLSGAYRAPLSVKAFAIEIYRGATLFIAFKGLVWAGALISMHHLGFAAVSIDSGRVHWQLPFVLLACVIAFVVTSIACICIRQMETQFSRQVLFSTVASAGVFCFHYTSVHGIVFITSAPPEPDLALRGFPPQLAFTIVGLAILSCVLASGMLAHNATLSRNRLAELVLTKRRMWRVIAEKEAVDRAAAHKQEFIAVASHELRTPLFSVTGYAELLARTDLSEEQTLYIKNVLSACASMNLLISNVLDFSKLERGNEETIAKPVCVNPRVMLEGLTRMTEDRGMTSGFHGVDVLVSVYPNCPETVFFDEAYVSRCVLNLLSNSLKHTQHGFVKVTLKASEDGATLELSVTDSGSGIPKKFRRALFEPYRQADSSLTAPHQGTGLGLSICKQLVQRLGGSIEFTSSEAEGESGTEFVVTMPVATPTPPPESLPSSQRIGISCRSPRTEATLALLLQDHGYTVSPVADRSAAELLQSVDLIWCDIESLDQSPVLRELLRVETSTTKAMLPLLVTTSGLSFDWPSGVESASNLILVRGPGIVLHRVLPMLANPAAHFVKPTPPPKVVKFAELPPKENPRSSPSPPKRKVLLAEDNLVNRALGKRILEKMDYEVLLAENGQEAVDQAMKEEAEVILMDCQMPIMDGHQATKAIRTMESTGVLKQRVWIIALTANVTQDAEERCRKDGFDLFLPKPLQFARLKQALEKYMGEDE